MISLQLILCTFPNREQARQIGTALIQKQLAACVNFIPGIESIYRWEGNIEHAEEVLAVFKTSTELTAILIETLATLHPYEVPEIIAISPTDALATYAKWAVDSVTSSPICGCED
ncbi:MAG: divalent-cation tolerance protein CutA [Verrucomicrobia bacterium]|nr:MAG: divalent-cation tolerance protein CutA [Verrucomicrobiota bacterium]